jgi:carboxylesterase type B
LFPAPIRYTPNADDEAIAALLGEAWTRFARTGDPSTAALAWPGYAIDADPYAGLDVPATTGEGVRTAQCDFWDDLGAG